MGRACDMPSDIIQMPTLNPEINTPSPDEPSVTVSHTHIRKLSFPNLTKHPFLLFLFIFKMCSEYSKVLLKREQLRLFYGIFGV